MKINVVAKNRRVSVCVFIFSFGLAFLPLNSLAAPITFGANESPPYWSKTLAGNGMCGEILHAISAASGLQSEIVFAPLERLINDNTNNDLGNPVFYMETQNFAAIIPIAIYKVNFIYYQPRHKQEIIINRLEDLKGYKIGILKGTLADRSYFSRAGIDFETSYYQDSLIKKMKLGRIDLSLEIDLVAHASIKKIFPNEASNFKFIEVDNANSPIAIMIAEDYPNAKEIGDKFRAGLKTIINNGVYHMILEKFYGADKVPVNWHKDLEKFNQLYSFNE
jgi:polar amino acid transport system substrate-binding protein